MRRLLLVILGVVSALFCFAQGSATIHRIWVEHNAVQEGKKGMIVHADFTVAGMKGEKIDCTAYFFDCNKNKLITTYSGYRTKSGHACTWSYANATYEHSRWRDFDNFIPYEAMNLEPGEHECYCKVYVLDMDSNILECSDYYGFTAIGSNTKRIYFNNGAYADETVNADGSITSVVYNPCPICNGRKECKLCNGVGGVWGGYGAYRRYMTCTSCQGSRKCKYCRGTGVTVLTNTYYPSTGTSIGEDLWSGRTFVSGGHNHDSSTSSSSSSVSCSICHGTGIDPYANESAGAGSYAGTGVAVGYTNHSNTKCPYCSKTTWHQHAYCPKCKADKYR